MGDDECNVTVEHGHCPLPDCGYVILTDPDMKRHCEDDHDLVEWVSSVGWLTLVLARVMETLDDFPQAHGACDLAVMILREEVEAEDGPRRN